MVVTEPSASRRLRWQLLGAGALGALLCHFWPFYSPFHVLVGGKGQTSDWIDKAAELTTQRRLHEFYGFRDLVRAFGVALPGVYFLTRMAHLRRHLFAPVGFVVTFSVFVANGFVPIPLGHRFVLLALVFVHIGMVWGCLQVLPGKAMAPGSAWSRWAARVLLGGLLVLGVRHNVEAAETRKRRVAGSAKSSYVLRYARQVGKHAGKDAVILGSRRALWSVPTFGPKVVSAYHSNPLVADEKQRRRDVSRFFSRKSSTQQRRDILERYHVTHLLIQPKSAAKLREIIAGRRPERIAAGYRLYDLRSEPASERGKPSKGLE